MGERKVLNKYFPPEFDPSLIPRRKLGADRQQEVRLMAPFSMRCNTCGEYIYKSKKFNARKETVQGETYFKIQIFRFYIKCPQCSAEITFKTDPRNTDYKAEHGATRNFEPWRASKSPDPDRDPLAHLMEAEEKDEAEDAMAALEQRTLESQREMEILDALQDIRTRNARNERVDADVVLARIKGKGKLDPEMEERIRAEQEDELLVRKYFSRDLAADEGEGSGGAGPSLSTGASLEASGSGSPLGSAEPSSHASAAPIIKRARPEEDEDAEPDVTSLLSESMRAQVAAAKAAAAAAAKPAAKSSVAGSANKLGIAPPAKRKKGTSAFGIVKKKS